MGRHWDENASTLMVVLLAFFTVVASSPNLSTFKSAAKVQKSCDLPNLFAEKVRSVVFFQ